MPPRIIYEKDGKWITFPLERDEVTIGRDGRNDLVIERPTVSRQHAKFYRDGEFWRVTDLGSLCGTRVNDLGHSDTVLRDGDKIFLHNFALVFKDDSAAKSIAAPVGAGPTEPISVDDRPSVSGVSLTQEGVEATDAGTHTVYQSTVDFSALATSGADLLRLQKLLAVVTSASQSLLSSATLDDTFNTVLELVFDHLPAQRGFVMLWDDQLQDFSARCVRHKKADADDRDIRFSRTIAEKVYRDRVAVLTTDAQADGRFAGGASVFELGIRSAMAAPLWNGDVVEGLIYIDTLKLSAFDKSDLDLLSALANYVAVAIEQSRLQDTVMEQRLKRRRLERYHSPAVVELITTNAGANEEAFKADERDVTVLFADVVDFTKRCEGMEPRAIAELLNHYFSEMAERVFRHQGTLDKYIGDCLMAVFGAPIAADAHARRAAEAVLDMREALDELNAPLPVEEQLRFRVGVHSGRVVAGDIGSVRRSDYTVLGATVNLAARLERKAQPGQILLSEDTRAALGDAFETRLVGDFRPKGISSPVRCYELIGRCDEPPSS